MTLPVESGGTNVRAGEVRAVSRAIRRLKIISRKRRRCCDCSFRTRVRRTSRSYWRAGNGKEHVGRPVGELSPEEQEQVGVIAVDPTSPYSGGAILGDRIRMQGHAGDAGTFIRSMARADFSAGLRERRRKWRCCWTRPGRSTC